MWGTTYTMEHELPFGICPVIIHGCCFYKERLVIY
jgi:hypothetical protein